METKDYISLALSGSALATTIIWNLHNRRHTDRMAGRIRGETFALEEWKAKRTEVLRTLRALEAKFAEITSLSKGTHKLADLLKLIGERGLALTVAHLAMLSELERIDSDWVEFGYGAFTGGERDWDQIHTILDDARSQKDADSVRVRLALIDDHVKSISRAIIEELNVKTAEFTPVKI